MFRNYLKIALRTLWKHRTHSLINVLGLAVAFGSATLLFLTAYFEWSFDRFHTDANRVFRTYLLIHSTDGDERSSIMPYPLTPALKQEFQEVEAVTRHQEGNGLVHYADKQLDREIDGVDADFLTVFSFPMRQGNPASALSGLNNIVLSEKTAKAIFEKVNPMGKLLRVNGPAGQKNFIVTGVIADAPDQSTLQFDALIRIENQPEYQADQTKWGSRNHEVFLKLRPGASAAAMESRLVAFTKKYHQKDIEELIQTGAKPDERGEVISQRLQPLTDVHFDTTLQGKGANRLYVYVLLAVGLFILLVAGINFVNLTLARSLSRAREVGVRKSLGAQRGQLFTQLWGEAVVLCGLGLALGVLAAYALRPAYNQLINTHLSLSLLVHPLTLTGIAVGFLVITLLAGGYPAWFMARYRAVDVLKGSLKGGRPGLLRNALITTQFAIACGLIVSTFVVLNQLRYLREKPLGFQEEQVISLPVGEGINGIAALRQVRDRLANNPNVVSVSGTRVNIGNGLDGGNSRSMSGFLYKGQNVTTDWLRVDYNYLKTLGIKLLAGRDFSPAFPSDSAASVIISESMAKQMGLKKPVGTTFRTGDAPEDDKTLYQIIGLIPDFHLYALRSKVEPITLHISPNTEIKYLFIRTTPQGMTATMQSLQTLWKEIAPKAVFQASFLNDNTDRWYRREERLSKLFSIAAGIAIGLSCLGLFAVALLSIEQRTKEIGVRKVLGASVASIVALLSKDFLKLVLIAIVIASPLAWYAMNEWLKEFAYKIDIEWWMFAGAGLLAVGIALLTVSFQSIKAALMNPVKSLRSE